MAAERLVRSRFAAWNKADSIGLRAALHLPHVNLPGPRVTIRMSESDLLRSADFRALQSIEEWHSSQLDRVDVFQSSADKAHCAADFGRKAADGSRYADGQAVYVVTNQNGHWGIQLNSVTLSPIGVGAGAESALGETAQEVLRRWVAAWDAGDATAMRRLVHLPFVWLDGTTVIAYRSHTGFGRVVLANTIGRSWQRSEVIRIDVRERSAHKIALEADIARFGADGTLLGFDPVLAIVTEVQNRWAMRVYSSFLTSSTANPRR